MLRSRVDKDQSDAKNNTPKNNHCSAHVVTDGPQEISRFQEPYCMSNILGERCKVLISNGTSLQNIIGLILGDPTSG